MCWGSQHVREGCEEEGSRRGLKAIIGKTKCLNIGKEKLGTKGVEKCLVSPWHEWNLGHFLRKWSG